MDDTVTGYTKCSLTVALVQKSTFDDSYTQWSSPLIHSFRSSPLIHNCWLFFPLPGWGGHRRFQWSFYPLPGWGGHRSFQWSWRSLYTIMQNPRGVVMDSQTLFSQRRYLLGEVNAPRDFCVLIFTLHRHQYCGRYWHFCLESQTKTRWLGRLITLGTELRPFPAIPPNLGCSGMPHETHYNTEVTL